jgi:hypothetical protein
MAIDTYEHVESGLDHLIKSSSYYDVYKNSSGKSRMVLVAMAALAVIGAWTWYQSMDEVDDENGGNASMQLVTP